MSRLCSPRRGRASGFVGGERDDARRAQRLRQLFGRYATYCGSSPFQASATLALVAHVEREGVWLVEGGMHRVARALARLAEARGARFRYGAEAAGVATARGRVAGVPEVAPQGVG